jgi:hypothetical protein
MSLKDLRKEIDGLPKVYDYDLEKWMVPEEEIFALIDTQPDPLAEARKKIEDMLIILKHHQENVYSSATNGGKITSLQWVLDEVLKEEKG